jgi:hypothetical protein
MAGVRRFIENQSAHERALAKAMNWVYIEGQKKGSCYDFTAPNGSKIEAKFDWDSIKTGNHYLETSQTSDGGKTWTPSGFSLSSNEADYWVVINNEWLRLFRVETLKNLVHSHSANFKITRTKIGVNFNRTGQFSKAYLIPFTTLDDYSLLKIRSPIQRNSS